MADQDQQQKILEFSGITGADEDRAKFYLQSSNWDITVAVGTFYDNSSEDQASQYAENPVDAYDDQEMASSDVATPPVVAQVSGDSRQESKSKSNKKSNIFSLSSYGGDESGGSDSEEGQEAFYAGGSEHSGQQILGPDKNKKKNPTGNLFDAAKKHGASVVEGSEESGSSKKKSYFRGAGFTLGSDVEPSQQVSSSLGPSNITAKPQTVIIKFWSNGFSIGNGPLRDFNDPENKVFLDSIAKGEVPDELRAQAQSSEVHVNMEDHREEEYVKPKESMKAFTGHGHMLGSPSPNITPQSSTPPAPITTDSPKSVYQVDESKPTTSIQIRLADGTRLVSKFNHDSTVGDIRNVVRNARPNTGNFNLLTTFPNKVLSEDSVTISDAKLLNAVIVQRMT